MLKANAVTSEIRISSLNCFPFNICTGQKKDYDEQKEEFCTPEAKGISIKELRRLTEETLLSSPGLGKLPNITSIYIAWKLH